MQRNDLKIFILVLILLQGCIKEYYPEIKSADVSQYVINGYIDNTDSIQKVTISMTSSLEEKQFIPVAGCTVVVSNDKGNSFSFNYLGNGVYGLHIDKALRVPGATFSIEVVTPDGEKITSEPEMMLPSPPIDSVYYERENIEGVIPGKFLEGIRFLADLEGNNTDARNFRWEAIETYEYEVDYPREWYYDGEIHHIDPPDYSLKVCWMTKMVPAIYTLTTKNLAENRYTGLPLFFVDNLTNKLLIGYSLLLKQYSLSDAAYVYWDQLKANSFEQGGLYDTQPFSVKGNLTNMTNTGKEVLGYFGASAVSEKRIFVKEVAGLEIYPPTTCTPARLRMGLRELTPADYPAFLVGDALGYRMIHLSHNCVDCTLAGGKNVKPDYWPW